jgi:PspAA-like protein
VIVRISNEGQYELPDGLRDELNEVDNRIVTAVESDDEASFRHSFDELLGLIRDNGTPLDGDDLAESELIVPPADLTLAEAERDFTGDGLLPD